MLYIGNHTSSSRGYLAMGKQMLANGGNTFAFFTRNPRGGKAKDIDPQDVQAFGQLAEENHFGKLVAHAPYTMNCCAAKENLRDFAREIMADDLSRLEMTPGNYYNFHPGSHVGQGAEAGISKIAEILNEVLTKDQSTIVLLETMSGKGTEVGRNFEELRQIIKLAGAPFIVKGVMTVKGALKAKEAGADAIIVSNHGGRVLDQCPATAEVLEAIVNAVGDSMKILVDGGIRSGADVFKALALGADGVVIARPFVTAVYGGEKEGVRSYIEKIGSELEDTMKMCGVSSLDEINRDCVFVG